MIRQRLNLFPWALAVSCVVLVLHKKVAIATLDLQWGEFLLLPTLSVGVLTALFLRKARRTCLDVPIAIYAASIVAALAVAGVREHSLALFRREAIALVMFYVVAWNLESSTRRKILATGFIASGIMASAIAFVQFAVPDVVAAIFPPVGSAGQVNQRGLVSFLLSGTPGQVLPVYAPFRHFNGLAAYLGIVFPLAAAGALGLRKLLWALGATAMALAVYFTYSRGGMMACFVAVSALGWFWFRATDHKNMAWVFGGMAAVLVALLLCVLFLTGYVETINLSARLPLWRLVKTQVAEHPVFGMGLNGVLTFLGERAWNASAHSDYVQTLGDRGIFGLGALLLLFAWGIAAGLNCVKKLRLTHSDDWWLPLGLVAGLMGFMLHATVDHQFSHLTIKVIIFAYLGLIAAEQGRLSLVSSGQKVGAVYQPPPSGTWRGARRAATTSRYLRKA